jgi:integrase
MPLSHIALSKLKPEATPTKVGFGEGLYVLMTPEGKKHWRFKYRMHGKEKLLALGTFPYVGIAEAQAKRLEAKTLLAKGIDPSVHKKEVVAKTEAAALNTFEAVARAWYAQRLSGWKGNTAGYVLRWLDREIIPAIGTMPITQINAQHVIKMIRAVEARQANDVARRIKSVCGQVFRYAIVEGLTDTNPVATFHNKDALKPYTKTHYAAFDARELPTFLQKLERNDARLFPHTRLAMRLMALTFVRTGELIQAEWPEFDLAEAQWVIPASRMKMKREHIVPLSAQAIAVLQELFAHRNHPALADWPDYVFPNQTRVRKHMNNNTLLAGLKRLGYRGQMTGHGFRSLAMSTIKEKLGYRHEVVDRQLAHAPANKIDAAYDRAEFLPERKVMMQQWGDYLDKQAAGGVIINMRRVE